MKNSMLMFIFFWFQPEVYFFFLICSKNQNCWSWNLESRLIWICRIRLQFSFFLVRKYPFCINLIQNSRVSSRRNLVARLISICKFYGDVHVFSFRPFCKFCTKISLLPDWSPSSLVAETWRQWFSLFFLQIAFRVFLLPNLIIIGRVLPTGIYAVHAVYLYHWSPSYSDALRPWIRKITLLIFS